MGLPSNLHGLVGKGVLNKMRASTAVSISCCCAKV